MKKALSFLLFCLVFPVANGQNNPYKIATSDVFEFQKKEVPLKQFYYKDSGILSVTGYAAFEFSFRMLSNDLKLLRENHVNLKERVGAGFSGFHNFIQFRDRTYLFVCNYQEKTKSEGITALEFSPDELDFVSDGQDLFLSAKKIRLQSKYPTLNNDPGVAEPFNSSIFSPSHGLFVSADKTKFMCTYGLVETDVKEGFEREKVGIHVFDQELKKLWGGEYIMPYAKDRMESLNYVMGNNGKAYFLIRVHNKSLKKEQVDGLPDYHYEVAIYEKGEPAPEMIPLDLDRNFVKAHEFWESADNKIVFGGMVGTYPDKKMNGLFVVKINIGKDSFGRVGKNYYNIPLETEHQYIPKEFLDGMRYEDKQAGHPFEEMRLREMRSHPDGSLHIMIEYYRTYLKSDHYNITAGDVYVFRIGADGKQSWVRKIPKNQENNSLEGYYISFNTLFVGDDLHLFYYDHKDNFNLAIDQFPAVFNGIAGSDLIGLKIGRNGEIQKYRLNPAENNDLDFGIRYFAEGEMRTLLRLEHKDHKAKVVVLKVE